MSTATDPIDAALRILNDRGWFGFTLTALPEDRWKFTTSRLDSTIGSSDLPPADLTLFAIDGVDYDSNTSTATIQRVNRSPRLAIIAAADGVLMAEAAAILADTHASTVDHLNDIIGRYGFGDAELTGDDDTGWTFTCRRPVVYTGIARLAYAIGPTPEETRLTELGLAELTVDHDYDGTTCHVEVTAATQGAAIHRGIQIARLAADPDNTQAGAR